MRSISTQDSFGNLQLVFLLAGVLLAKQSTTQLEQLSENDANVCHSETDRKQYNCCRGWSQVGNQCTKAICTQPCVNGNCTKPDYCSCDPGYHGKQCERDIDCPLDKWGPGCTNNCECTKKAICSLKTGICTCPPGSTGRSCEECVYGYFGKNCQNLTICYNGASFAPGGKCICANGYYGERCEYKCEQGKFGHKCSQTCTCPNNTLCSHINGICCQCYNNATCHPNGSCDCSPEWTGEKCDKPNQTVNDKACKWSTGKNCKGCVYVYFGKNCRNLTICYNGASFAPGGKCICADGYYGERCEYKCEQGKFGYNCSQTCTCPNNTLCSHINGICCQCYNNATCQPNGSCDCSPGWTGEKCDRTHQTVNDNQSNCSCVNRTFDLKACRCRPDNKSPAITNAKDNRLYYPLVLISIPVIIVVVTIHYKLHYKYRGYGKRSKNVSIESGNDENQKQPQHSLAETSESGEEEDSLMVNKDDHVDGNCTGPKNHSDKEQKYINGLKDDIQSKIKTGGAQGLDGRCQVVN